MRFRVDVTFVLSLHMHPSTSQSRSSVASCLDLLFGEVQRPQSRVGGSSLTHASVHVSVQPFSLVWKRGLSWLPANFAKGIWNLQFLIGGEMSLYGWVPCRWFVGVACMPYGLGLLSLSLASIACIKLWSYGYKSRLLMDPLCIRGSRALSRDNFALLRRSKLDMSLTSW